MDDIALGLIVTIVLQTGLITLGTWVFQEPERRLIRVKGVWPGLVTYGWVAAVVVIASAFANQLVGGLLWWVLAMGVLGLTFRQTLMIGIGSFVLVVVVVILAFGSGPVPEAAIPPP